MTIRWPTQHNIDESKARNTKVSVTNNVRQGKDSLVIRDARPEESDRVSLLLRDAYLEYKEHFPPGRWELYLEDMMDVRSRLGDAELIIAELRGRMAGAVTLYLDGSRSGQEGWPAGWAYIRLLAVHPSYRGQGIGRALMEECIRRCRKHSIKMVALHTAEIMGIARKMYESMGFVRAREYDFYPAPGTVVEAYRLQLSG